MANTDYHINDEGSYRNSNTNKTEHFVNSRNALKWGSSVIVVDVFIVDDDVVDVTVVDVGGGGDALILSTERLYIFI